MNETILRRTESGHEVAVVETVHEVGEAEWNAIVNRSSRASFFHRFEWIAAVEGGLEYEPNHLVVKKDGNTIGLFPNFVRGIPRTPFRRLSSIHPRYGGPLLPTDMKRSLELIVEAVPEVCTGRTIVHEIRALDTGYLRYDGFLRSKGYRPYRGECRHLIDLTRGYDEILASMSDSRRKEIRRGERVDYEIVEEDLTSTSIERFYRVYERVMGRVGGNAYPRTFFERLSDIESRVLLVTIRIDGEYAGGMLELLDDERSTVDGFIAAVPEEYFDDNASALLYDYVIRWGIEHGYETYDLGKSTPAFEDGVFAYKEGFGGRVMPSLVWERGCNPLWKLVRIGRRKYRFHNW